MKTLITLFFSLILAACGGGSDIEPLVELVAVAPMSYQTTGHGVRFSMSPQDLKTHYNMPSQYQGEGQTIAIVTVAGVSNIIDDFNTFSNQYGLPTCTLSTCLKVYNLGTKSAAQALWDYETALDTQWAHAIAPKANIIVVQAKSALMSDIFVAIQYAAAQPNVTAISMSFGAIEYSSQISSQYDGIFKKYPHIAFFAASGDSGNNGNRQMYPAASPYVTAVGGTTINKLATSTSSGSESAWSLTGGGYSMFETMPATQTNFFNAMGWGVNITKNRSMRAIPDVAYNADYQASPVAVVNGGRWYLMGGTSAGAPQWAGIAANFAQYLTTRGTTLKAMNTSKGGFNAVLYQTKLETTGVVSYYDILTGVNGNPATCTICSATIGYDDLTGLGVPNVAAFFAHF
jgi:subtilase family serine protease